MSQEEITGQEEAQYQEGVVRQASFTLIGNAPMSQSGPFTTPKKERELDAAYEERCWMDRLHTNENGYVIIPQMALKQCLDASAKYLSMKVPGKGNSTYTKHFRSGVLFLEPPVLNVHRDEVVGVWHYMNSDGVRGSGKRVWRKYPRIEQGWKADASCLILDGLITESIFAKHLLIAGQLIGVGRFRPENSGFFGRFTYEGLRIEDADA